MPTTSFFGVPVVMLSSLESAGATIYADMVNEVEVTEESMVTKHPTEVGLNVTDHVVNLPVVIRMSGRFLDSPLTTPGGGGLAVFNPLQSIASLVESGGTRGRAVEQWAALEDLRLRKEPFSVHIQQGDYESMVIASLKSPRGRGDGSSLRFQLEMHQIITTILEGAGGTPVDESVEHTAGGVQGLGEQPTSLVG